MRALIILLSSLSIAIANPGFPSSPFKLIEHNDTSSKPAAALDDANLSLEIDAIRPKTNQADVYPNEHTPFRNPPSLVWPSHFDGIISHSSKQQWQHKEKVRYHAQISRTADFKELLEERKDIEFNYLNNYAKFENGTWYWRYRTVVDGQAQDWSPSYSFTITSDTPVMASPPFAEAAKNIPTDYPRLNVSADALDPKWPDHRTVKKIILENAKKALKTKSILYSKEGYIKKDQDQSSMTEAQRKTATKFQVKYGMSKLLNDAQALAAAQALKPNPRYTKRVETLLEILLEKDLEAMFHNGNDFAAASGFYSLALLFDGFLADLPADTQALMLKRIAKIGDMVYKHSTHESPMEVAFTSAHFFQHTARYLFEAGVATYGQIPEAEKWLAYLYDIFLARTPSGGFVIDGGWANGNQGYYQVNMETLVYFPNMFREWFGVNLFEHPWYQAAGYAQLYTYPANSVGEGFGDGLEKLTHPSGLRSDFAYILAAETKNPHSSWYAYQGGKNKPGKPYKFTKKNLLKYRAMHKVQAPDPVAPSDLPKAVALTQSGSVLMHTALADTPNNLFVSFHSSPFGAGSHAHPEQNSFNILYGGSPIFYPLGYRVTTRDKHYSVDHRHTRAKNTIQVNDKTQSWVGNGYGWIPRFLHGDTISYTLGDASNAYKAFDDSALNWIEGAIEPHGIYDDANGFIIKEDPQVKHFRPSTVVIYDELESAQEVDWQFGLNTREQAPLEKLADGQLLAKGTHAWASVSISSSATNATTLRDQYLVPPVDWLNPQRGRKARDMSATHFHSTTGPTQKLKKLRFLTVIKIDPEKRAHKIEAKADGSYHIDGFRIAAELDTTKAPSLLIKGQTAELIYGGGRSAAPFRKYKNSTILRDKIDGKTKILEAIDTPPLKLEKR